MTLIERVLSVIPTYYLSLVLMSSEVIKEVEKIMRNFLWNGMDGDRGGHLVSWKVISRAKCKGGLGTGKLRDKNKALLFKWL